MPEVEVKRLDVNEGDDQHFGEHIWLVVAFGSGMCINIRIDEFEGTHLKKYDSVITVKKGRNGFTKEKEIKI